MMILSFDLVGHDCDLRLDTVRLPITICGISDMLAFKSRELLEGSYLKLPRA